MICKGSENQLIKITYEGELKLEKIMKKLPGY